MAHILSAAVHITGVPDLEGLSKKILSSENHFSAVSSILRLCALMWSPYHLLQSHLQVQPTVLWSKLCH